jgi:predicted nucleic acid-binding protein
VIERGFLDTGVITLYYAKDVLPRIEELFNQIKAGTIEACVISPIIVEVYFQLCRKRGKAHAETSINHFSKEIPHTLVQLDRGAEFRAGALKCEHRAILSYADCMGIAVALQLNATFHTTEKDLPPLARLQVKKYSFSRK